MVVKLMANRYDLPKAERIVKKDIELCRAGNTGSPSSCVRLNLGWLMFAPCRWATRPCHGENDHYHYVLPRSASASWPRMGC